MKIPICNYMRALMRVINTKEKDADNFAGNVCFDVSEYYAVKEALEKQIPTEHHHTRIVNVECKMRESTCPNCLGAIVTKEDEYPKHCTWCGQRIKWKSINWTK